MKKVFLSRDSASAGDDIESHDLVMEVSNDWNITEIITEAIRINYLPKVYGGKATWSVACQNPVAIIAQQWNKPKFINEFYFNIEYKNVDRLHFNYHAQDDPDLVYKVLMRFKMPV